MQRVLFRIVVALAVVALLAVVYSASEKPEPAVTLPKPNGYDDFVAAGKMLAIDAGNWDDLEIDKLRSVLETNKPVFALVRKGLTRTSQFPTDYSQTDFPRYLSDLGNMKHLAQALSADGKLAEAEGRNDDAAEDYATTIELGAEANRGGFLIHSLVDDAIEAIGAKKLTAIVSILSAQESRQCLQALVKAETDRDSFDKIKAQEKLFYLHAPLREKLADLPLRLIGRDGMAASLAKTESKYIASVLLIRKLSVQLAAHAFELEKGRPATNWSDLVPGYLASIPNDPTKNRPIAFDSW